MKKRKLITAVALVVLVGVSVFSTLAYFTDKADKTNPFVVGNIDLELNEPTWDKYTDTKSPDYNPEYNVLVPNKQIAKDPIVTLKAKSEASYLFVKLENGLVDANQQSLVSFDIDTKSWLPLSEDPTIYVYSADGLTPAVISKADADQNFTFFTQIIVNSDAQTGLAGLGASAASIHVTAFAHQATIEGQTDAYSSVVVPAVLAALN